jgi:hypothetical protein
MDCATHINSPEAPASAPTRPLAAVGEIAAAEPASAEKLAQFDALVRSHTRKLTRQPVRLLWEHLVRYLRDCLLEGRLLPDHPAHPGKVCIKAFASQIKINASSLRSLNSPNRQFLNACASLIGLEPMRDEDVGRAHQGARSTSKRIRDYTEELERKSLGLPCKLDGSLNLQAIAGEARIPARLLYKSEKRVSFLEQAKLRIGERHHGVPVVGPLKLCELSRLLAEPARIPRLDSDEIYQLRFTVRLIQKLPGIDEQAGVLEAANAALAVVNGRDAGRVRHLISTLEVLQSDAWLPAEFGKALEYLFDRHGFTTAQAAREVGMPQKTLGDWKSGKYSPDRLRGFPHVARLEDLFSLERGDLWDLVMLTGDGSVPRKYWPPEIPKTERIRRMIIPRLPDDLLMRTDEAVGDEMRRVWEVVKKLIAENVDEHHKERSRSPYRYHIRDWTEALLEERQKIIEFINVPLPRIGEVKLMGPHAPQSTELGEEYLQVFFGYISSCRGEGRNVPVSRLSHVYLLIGELAVETVNFLISRRPKKTKKTSPKAIPNDVSFFFRCMALASQGGFFSRHPELAAKLKPVPGVLTPAQCEEARRDWKAFCDGKFREYEQLLKSMKKKGLVARPGTPAGNNPLIKLQVILDRLDPLEFLDGMAAFYDEAAARSRVGKRRWIYRVRAAVLSEIAAQTYLRSGVLRGMIFLLDGMGELRLVDGVWWLIIHKSKFKNGETGPFFKDGEFYIKRLADRHGLYRNLDDYLRPVTGARALILGTRNTDVLFVKDSGEPGFQSADKFYQFFTAVSARYIASAEDKPWSSLIKINPHAIRAIAYSALKRLKGGETAANALAIATGTGERHYNYDPPHRKTARVDDALAERDANLRLQHCLGDFGPTCGNV